MDLLFLRSMIKLWVHGGVPFYITLFFSRYSLSTSKDCFKDCAQISFVKSLNSNSVGKIKILLKYIAFSRSAVKCEVLFNTDKLKYIKFFTEDTKMACASCLQNDWMHLCKPPVSLKHWGKENNITLLLQNQPCIMYWQERNTKNSIVTLL